MTHYRRAHRLRTLDEPTAAEDREQAEIERAGEQATGRYAPDDDSHLTTSERRWAEEDDAASRADLVSRHLTPPYLLRRITYDAD